QQQLFADAHRTYVRICAQAMACCESGPNSPARFVVPAELGASTIWTVCFGNRSANWSPVHDEARVSAREDGPNIARANTFRASPGEPPKARFRRAGR